MSGIRFANGPLSKIYFNAALVPKAYLGSYLVWGSDPGGELFTPTNLSSKTFWLRGKDLTGADGSTLTVATVVDKSGLDNNPTLINSGVTKLDNALNGKPAFRFFGGTMDLPQIHPTRRDVNVSVSGVYNAGYAPKELVNGLLNYGNGWATKNKPSVVAPQWAQFEFATSRVLTSYTIYPLSINHIRSPKDFTFEGSNDGVSWNVLDTQVGVTWPALSQTFNFANTNAYKFYILRCTAIADTGDILHLYEIEFNGEPNGDPFSDGELWFVIRAQAEGNYPAWGFGESSGGSNYYAYADKRIYASGFSNARIAVVPSLPLLSEWRLVRMRQEAGVFKIWVDERLQYSESATVKWASAPTLANNSRYDIAEALVITDPTSETETAQMIDYVNREHGLSIPTFLPIITDTFNRPNETIISGWTLENTTDWSIVSNRLAPGSTGGNGLIFHDTPMSSPDHFVEVRMPVHTSTSQGIVGRALDIGHYYLLRSDSTTWTLFVNNAGNFIQLGSVTQARAAEDVVRVEFQGSTIRSYRNGILLFETTDSTIPNGTRVGLRAAASSTARYDNFIAGPLS